jgi:hypothetical protein
MILVLAGYRLRPVPWTRLAGLALGWLLLTRALAAAAPDPGARIGVLRWAAALLGLGAALLAAPEADPSRDVLRAAPVPSWRALALRLGGWLALGAAPILVLAALLGPATGWSAADLARGALPGFLLATAAGFMAAGRTSILGGEAVAMAVLVALDTAARAWPAWFPIQLASVPSDPRWSSSRAWTVGLSLALVVAALALEALTGARFHRPRRRAMVRPSPASEARARS